MIRKILLTIFFFINCYISFSQDFDFTQLFQKNGITKPSILSTHPFGIFFTRAQGNFKTHAIQNKLLQVTLKSGNVWAAPVTAYIPNDDNTRERARNVPWHGAEFAFDEELLDAKTIEIAFDGVLKGLRAQASFNLGKSHQLDLGFRSYILSNGKFPLSSLTSDSFIEFFHKTIAGGDDPFGRELFGLNQANISYKDRNDKVLKLSNGDFVMGGIEVNYFYYPTQLTNDNKTLFFNFGAHLGSNLSKYNSSIDFGLSGNAIKTYTINDSNYFYLGLSIGSIKRNVLEFRKDNIDFGNNVFNGYLESVLEYNFVSKGKTTHSFGVDFYFQTSLNKKDEFDYIIPIRNGVTEKSWVTGISHLYKNNNYWTILYSFTRKLTTTFYIQQDLNLNNNPDIQTGVSMAFKL